MQRESRTCLFLHIWTFSKYLVLFHVIQGASKKRGICFAISISIKLNTNLLGIYLSRKMGSTALSGVQKHFCTISGSQGISKPIWGIKFQEFQIMNNLISLNMISTWCMHDFSSYKHFRGLAGKYNISEVTFLGMFHVQSHFCTT